jgi:hypothetical protein
MNSAATKNDTKPANMCGEGVRMAARTPVMRLIKVLTPR